MPSDLVLKNGWNRLAPVLGRHAAAVIDHRELRHVVDSPHDEVDVVAVDGAVHRVDRVLQQIQQQLLDQDRIDVERRQVGAASGCGS